MEQCSAGEAHAQSSAIASPVHRQRSEPTCPKIFVVEDNELNRAAMCGMVSDAGWEPQSFPSCEAFLKAYRPREQTCLVLDIHFPGMGGLELLDAVGLLDDGPPVVVVSGSSRISEAVQALQAGASDYIEKPFPEDRLVASIRTALARARHLTRAAALRRAAIDHICDLTDRQRQVMEMVLAGAPSKNIAADLGISQRTVENHRAAIMHKTGAHSLPALSRLVMCNRCSLAAGAPPPVQ
jgi:two-component system CheB/CheR fusion protein